VGVGGTIRRLGGAGRHLVKELGAFGVVGAACFVIDVGLFQLLYAQLGAGAVTSKFLATAVSMTAAYLGHRYWSFAHRSPTSGYRGQYLRFAVVNGVTLLLGLAIVALVRYPLEQTSALVLQAANIGSIVLGTAIRYLSYRFWVFPAGGPVSALEPLPPAPPPAPLSPGVPEASVGPGQGTSGG
jgi:putative flippase GtrA